MFTMDVPSVPVQDAPIALIQVAADTAALPPDYQLNVCKETESTGNPRSAMRAVDPATMLIIYLENRDHRAYAWDEPAAVKLTLLEGPAHGALVSGVANGRTAYRYDVESKYTGNDKAVFMAEYGDKRYKIVVDLRVFLMVDEKKPVCPPPKLIKVNGKPVSDSSPYLLNSFTVTFGELGGSAVGETSGTDITLAWRESGRAGQRFVLAP
jgi:hypothetical protein